MDFLERGCSSSRSEATSAGKSTYWRNGEKEADDEQDEVVAVDDDDVESDRGAPESDHTEARDRLLRRDFTGTSASVDSAQMVGVRIGSNNADAAPSCGRRCCGLPHAANAAAAAGSCGSGSSASESSMIRDTHSSSSTSCACTQKQTPEQTTTWVETAKVDALGAKRGAKRNVVMYVLTGRSITGGSSGMGSYDTTDEPWESLDLSFSTAAAAAAAASPCSPPSLSTSQSSSRSSKSSTENPSPIIPAPLSTAPHAAAGPPAAAAAAISSAASYGLRLLLSADILPSFST